MHSTFLSVRFLKGIALAITANINVNGIAQKDPIIGDSGVILTTGERLKRSRVSGITISRIRYKSTISSAMAKGITQIAFFLFCLTRYCIVYSWLLIFAAVSARQDCLVVDQ
ncbi:MAG: hypothetical protein DI538_25895 [Azospira oryzae]|nr:MAG: hypothetical protein DI538_25895 [Azospira oryzae]